MGCCNNRPQVPTFELQFASKKQGQGYTAYLPFGARNAVLNAIKIAEEERGEPVYLVDIRRAFDRTAWVTVGPGTIGLNMALCDLYRNDEILCDREMNRYSVKGVNQETKSDQTGYELFSDRFHKMYTGYVFDKKGLIQPGPDTPVVNFDYLKELLLSKDLSRGKELEWIGKDAAKFRFLDGKVDMSGNKVAFCSYPRSGNSFLRNYLETITGIATGSDIYIEITVSLQIMGMLAESHAATDNVWITKTHHPWESVTPTKFNGNKCIFMMRNPIDVIPSLASLGMLMSHSLQPDQEYHVDHPVWWHKFVKRTTWEIQQSFKTINENCMKAIPTYCIRYEDLRNEPLRVLTELFCFVMDVPSIEGTVLEDRIKQQVAEGGSKKTIYKLKASTTGNSLSKNNFMYNEEQIALMKTELKEYLHYFGYAQNETKDSPTGFFEYTAEDNLTDDVKGLRDGFRRHNEKVLAALPNKTDKIPEYYFNGPDRYKAEFTFSKDYWITDQLTVGQKKK